MFSPFASRLKNIQLADFVSSLVVAPMLSQGNGGKRGDAIPRGGHTALFLILGAAWLRGCGVAQMGAAWLSWYGVGLL